MNVLRVLMSTLYLSREREKEQKREREWKIIKEQLLLKKRL